MRGMEFAFDQEEDRLTDTDPLQILFQSRSQRRVEACVPKLKSRLQEGLGLDATTFEQKRLPHLTERETDGPGRKWQHGGAMERAAEFASEASVPNRMRRDDIDGACESTVRDGMADRVHRILDGNPTHPLATIADWASEPEAKG